MSDYQEISIEFRSSSSSENRDSINSSNAETDGGDEEFYEKIEAPKFVDFTVADNYRPDDRYWFCRRVGCDQKHEEELDPEEIYKDFVLRVMAARSPNVRLRKAVDRNALRTPVKCPLSAPPKPSKPRLSRMAIISSISKKMVDDKKRVKPPLKSGSTPMTKTKPVPSKYLTTPREKKSISNRDSFRSVRNPKPVNVEVEKSRVVAKALVFHSPKKVIKVKTSVELKTPISKLCQGMNKLEISTQKKRTLGYSSKLSMSLSNRKLQRKPEEPLHSRTNQEAKSGKFVKHKTKGQLSQQEAPKKLLEGDETNILKNNESCEDTEQKLAKNVTEESGLRGYRKKEACVASTVTPPTHDSDLASPDDLERDVTCLDIEGSDSSKSQARNGRKEDIASDSSGEPIGHSNVNNSSEAERKENHEIMDSDDKENISASDGNRLHSNNLKQTGRKVLGLHDKCGQVQKKVTQQAETKNLKEGSSGPAIKLTKPKPTNPKPFRLRTDERCILRETSLERRTDLLTPPSENANLSTPGGKLQKKQGNTIQKGNMMIGVKTPKGHSGSKAAAAPFTPESNKNQERKGMDSHHQSSAMQRLEKFKKIASPLPKHSVRPQGLVSTKEEMISYLIPGQKLDVIHEVSPEIGSEPRRVGKPTANAPQPMMLLLEHHRV